MKKIGLILLISLLFTLFIFPVSAEEENARVVDQAGLLDSFEESSLEREIAEIADEYRFDVVIVFVEDIGYSTPTAFADDYFDYNGYGYGSSRDGILLLVSMEERDWYISTSGSGIDEFSDRTLDSIGGDVAGYLSDGDYYEAAKTFIVSTEAVLSGEYKTSDGSLFIAELIVIAVSLVLAFAIAGAVKRSMNNSRKQTNASDYVPGNGIDLTVARDTYLYSTVTKVKIESSSSGSSSHRSSSGHSHGGRGGKF